MNENEPKPAAGEPPKTQPVKFLQERSSLYRSVHVDGVWGSIDGYGNIHLTFFHEHTPVPIFITVPVNAEGVFISEETKEQYKGDANVIRELEFETILSLSTAKLIYTVLGNFIKIREGFKQGRVE